MDLSAYDLAKAGEKKLELLNPLGEPMIDEETSKPVSITLIGRESTRAEQRRVELSNRRLDRTLNAGSSRISLSTEGIEADALEVTVTCTVAWEGIIVDGERLECTPENARRVYKRFAWIREQVDQFITTRRNFLGN